MAGHGFSTNFPPQLGAPGGRQFWRSLDELAGTEEFHAFLAAEFPSLMPLANGIERRSLLRAMAASLTLAGLTGCKWDTPETALPYVRAPEFTVPGQPKYYATAVSLSGYALPVVAKTHVGRPVKLEGNTDHPASGGASDVFLQASLLGLYDPDRSQAPRHLGRPATWQAFDADMARRMAEFDATRGAGLRLLTGAVTSPTLLRQIAAMAQRWPEFRWHVSEPLDDGNRRAAAQLAFGARLDRHLHLERADTVICLDDDILGPGPHQARNARCWSQRRKAYRDGDGACRLFVAEPTPTLTGAKAERRLVVSTGRIAELIVALERMIGGETGDIARLDADERQWLERAAAAIHSRPTNSLVTIGANHPPPVQALALRLNSKLKSTAVQFTAPIAASAEDGAVSLVQLAGDMAAGDVQTLLMLDANPFYAAPGELGWSEAADKVPLLVHAGDHYDESAAHSHWHVPLAHELEAWSDARAVDGTASIVQPVVRPLYHGRAAQELLARLMGDYRDSRAIVQATWRAVWRDDFDARWTQALTRGFIEASAPAAVSATPLDDPLGMTPPPADGLTVVIQPDLTIWDGRFANNAWLQELPKPFGKITWGNVIGVSPQLAATRAIRNGDELVLEADGRQVAGPAWIMPGQEANTLTLTLGYGRQRGGHVAQNLGYDAYAFQGVAHQHVIAVTGLQATGRKLKVATTQMHQAIDGYDFVREVDDPRAAASQSPNTARASLYPAKIYDSPSWGMSIDLDACIGCNACVVACTAENNVPVVGKELVAQGREMHWLRVDQYYEGDPVAPRLHFQPVPCMHCEQAPCEMGCPVNAAVHSEDGLNLQVYNRCIGTRTCSSYCPYKVRRFNWFEYTGDDPESLRAMRNPDVTVRSRGVMEKCTYCLQRISAARIAAKREDRPIGDGEIVTACQQACPTQAIVFGDVIDPDSAVSSRKAEPRNYALLEEANTRPRTTYLAKIRPEGDGE